jgi:hypothetical protein
MEVPNIFDDATASTPLTEAITMPLLGQLVLFDKKDNYEVVSLYSNLISYTEPIQHSSNNCYLKICCI